MKKASHNTKKGFTLIELILYMGMFSVILLVLSALFTAIIDTQLDVEATSAVEADSKFVASRLMYDIQRAESITTPASLGGQGSSLTLVVDGTVFVYSLQNQNLLLTVGSDSQQLNGEGSSVTDLTFTRLGNAGSGAKPAVRTQITFESTVAQPQDPETKTVDITIGLR